MSSTILPQLPSNAAIDSSKISAKFDEGLEELDAQRVMSILNEAEKKFALLAILPQHLDKKVASVLTIDTVFLLTAFRNAEMRLNNQITDGASAADIKESSISIGKLTRNIYRHFTANPDALNKLKLLSPLQTVNPNDLQEKIKVFKGMVYEKLKTSTQQLNSDQDALESIVMTEKRMREEIDLLKVKLQSLREVREVTVTKKDNQIDRLKDELRNIRKQAEDANKKLDQRSSTKENTDCLEFTEKSNKLAQEINTIEKEYSDSVNTHRDEESGMRRRKAKVEAEVENWLAKYDQDLGEKQVDIDELMGLYLDEKAQSDELLERFNIVKATYDGIQTEMGVESARVEKEMNVIESRTRAAIKIQAFIRGFLSRRMKLKANVAKPTDKSKGKPKAKK